MFLEEGAITRGDVDRLIELTELGKLRWKDGESTYAYSAQPVSQKALDSRMASEQEVGKNLRDIRIGFNPTGGSWHYLRLLPADGHYVYAEPGVGRALEDRVTRLFELAKKAARLGGTLSSPHDEGRYCSRCEKETAHRHLEDRPYGLAGAVMAGSERYVCTVCEHSQGAEAS